MAATGLPAVTLQAVARPGVPAATAADLPAAVPPVEDTAAVEAQVAVTAAAVHRAVAREAAAAVAEGKTTLI